MMIAGSSPEMAPLLRPAPPAASAKAPPEAAPAIEIGAWASGGGLWAIAAVVRVIAAAAAEQRAAAVAGVATASANLQVVVTGKALTRVGLSAVHSAAVAAAMRPSGRAICLQEPRTWP